MKRLAIILFILQFAAWTAKAAVHFDGYVSSDFVHDDNAYKDFTKLGDYGFQSNVLLHYSTKIFSNTFPSLHYILNSNYFLTEKLYNENYHTIKASVRQYASGILDYGMELGVLVDDYPNLNKLSWDAPYINPFILLYPGGKIESEIGFKYKKYDYPNYDLDSNNAEIYLNLNAPVAYGTKFEFDLSQDFFDYTERHQYAISASQTRMPNDTLRKDGLSSAALRLNWLFTGIGEMKISYGVAAFNSNANEFYSALLLSGNIDTRLLANFRSYNLNRIDASFKSGLQESLLVKIYASYYNQKFAGWPARTTKGIIRIPNEFRKDNFYRITVRPERRVFDNLVASVSVDYQLNSSNDLIYDYSSTAIGAGLSWNF